MAYVKPGVEIVQEARSTTPALITPDLMGVLVGNGYYWQDPSIDASIVVGTTYDGTSTQVALSGINTIFNDVTGLEELVVVDLITISGNGIGDVTHLVYTDDYTVANKIVTISANVAYQSNLYQIRIGYLALKNSSDYGFKTLYSLADVEETIGEPVSWNPLAFGARLAMLNSGREVNVINISGVTANDMEQGLELLGTREVYAIAPVTHNLSIGTMQTHVDLYSSASYKKERIAIMNQDLSGFWAGTAFSTDNTEKNNTVLAIRDANIAYLDRRVVITHPDVAYITETRHISTISPTWIADSFTPTSPGFAAYGLKAKFAFDAFINGKKFKAGTEITETIWAEIRDAGWAGGDGMVTVKVPVPGYYYPALVVGQVIGEFPEQPLTNLPTTGLEEVYGSSDYYNEAQLNYLAEGGTYIMVQANPNAPIVSRHQLTTDMTQVSKRELSIVKALDYVAKFIRKSMSPYIGRYTITPAFLKLVNSILISISLYLTREGRIADMKILSVAVDDIAPDTIRVTVDIKVKYPVNYIKVTLLF
jgi:hypothetical protein